MAHQFERSLGMLKEAIENSPDELDVSASSHDSPMRLAYHTLEIV